MFSRLVWIHAVLLIATASGEEPVSAVRTLIPWLLQEAESLKGISFAEVISATSGKRVLPVDRADPEDQRVLAAVGKALDAVLLEMNAPSSKTRSARRVNEMSSHFENALPKQLNAVSGLKCSVPKTTAGKLQRSGYPDLRLLDEKTGRIFYLDPKLFAQESRASSLRTFYFEPKQQTNKVTEDARHLIIGIAHERMPDGTVRFARWELVDLSSFRVRLKAEFEGSNADLYRPEAIVGSGPK